MIVVIPDVVLGEVKNHASSELEKEIIGVFIGRNLYETFIEIVDILKCPDTVSEYMAKIPFEFFVSISNDIHKRNDSSISMKGYYHTHLPRVFPLIFSDIDKDQYIELQRNWAENEPFIALIMDPTTGNYEILTLDRHNEMIKLKKEKYKNLILIDYGAVRGFENEYYLDRKQMESILDELSEKYEKKEKAKKELNKLSKAAELLDNYRHIKEIEEFINKVNELHEHYYTEEFNIVSSSIYSLKEEFKELWRKIEKLKKTQKKGEKNKPYREILVLENLIEKYYKEHWKETQEDLSFILDGKIKRECGISATFSILSKNLKFNKKLKNLFKRDYDKKMKEIERSIEKFIVNKIGEEKLRELKKEVNK